MATVYPSALDGAPATHADVSDGAAAVQAELGVNPSGGQPTVARRVNRLAHGVMASLPNYVVGRYYDGATNASGGSITPATANLLILSPFFALTSQTFDRIGVAITTAPTSGTGIRLGIYVTDDTGYPSDLVLDAGAVGIALGGQEAIISQALTEDRLYWTAFLTDGAAGNIRTRQRSSMPHFGFATVASDGNIQGRLAVTTTYGALPASVAGSAWQFAATDPYSVRLRAA